MAEFKKIRLAGTQKEWAERLNDNFAEIETRKADSSAVSTAISTAVSEHNTSADAHSDLFNSKINVSEKGAANGVATLGANGKVLEAQLPDFVLEETDPTVPAWAKEATKPTYKYSEITEKPELATVATSGSYNDLTDKPTIPSVNGLASETYVDTKIANLVNSAPETLDTLGEIAAALDNNKDIVATLNNAIATKANASDLTELAGRVTTNEGEIAKKANTADLAKVATSGSYNDLTDKPTIPSTDGLASEDFVNTAVASLVKEYSFSTDSSWSELVDGVYTLTISSTAGKRPIAVYNSSNEQVMATLKYDSTNIYMVTDEKFAGKILAI